MVMTKSPRSNRGHSIGQRSDEIDPASPASSADRGNAANLPVALAGMRVTDEQPAHPGHAPASRRCCLAPCPARACCRHGCPAVQGIDRMISGDRLSVPICGLYGRVTRSLQRTHSRRGRLPHHLRQRLVGASRCSMLPVRAPNSGIMQQVPRGSAARHHRFRYSTRRAPPFSAPSIMIGPFCGSRNGMCSSAIGMSCSVLIAPSKASRVSTTDAVSRAHRQHRIGVERTHRIVEFPCFASVRSPRLAVSLASRRRADATIQGLHPFRYRRALIGFLPAS